MGSYKYGIQAIGALNQVITIFTLLRTPLITTHESQVSPLINGIFWIVWGAVFARGLQVEFQVW